MLIFQFGSLCSGQCDQMVRLFFSIWPFATMKISPIRSQICQSRLSILLYKKYKVKNWPNTCKLLPKWQNFAKSGHTGYESHNLVTNFFETGRMSPADNLQQGWTQENVLPCWAPTKNSSKDETAGCGYQALPMLQGQIPKT